MKAYVLHGIGDLRYEDADYPFCGPGWAVVKIKASGVCSSDIPRIYTKGTYHFPTIPGHEFSGIVEKVSDINDQIWIGKRVSVFPLLPCRECAQCREGHYEMCEHYDYLGSRRDGGFAEYTAVPVWNMIELPENVSFVAGAMLEPLSVALHAVKTAGIGPGNTVAVIGTGTIGIAAAVWAKIKGASKVYVIGRRKEKQEFIEKFGGLDYINSQESSQIQEADISIEAVGTSAAVNMAIRYVKPGGRLILIGNPESDIHLEQDIYWRILRKQLHISGIWNSSYGGRRSSDWKEVLQILSECMIPVERFISHIYLQEQLEEGLKMMRDHKEIYCKVMSVWNGD